MSSLQADKFFLTLLANLRAHSKRFVEFHRKQKAPDKEKPYTQNDSQTAAVTQSVGGPFTFGWGTNYPDIHNVFQREDIGTKAAKAYKPNAEIKDLELEGLLVQNDLLAAAEKTLVDMSRNRIKQSVYAVAQRNGHSSGLGVTSCALYMATRQAVTKKG